MLVIWYVFKSVYIHNMFRARAQWAKYIGFETCFNLNQKLSLIFVYKCRYVDLNLLPSTCFFAHTWCAVLNTVLKWCTCLLLRNISQKVIFWPPQVWGLPRLHTLRDLSLGCLMVRDHRILNLVFGSFKFGFFFGFSASPIFLFLPVLPWGNDPTTNYLSEMS